MVQCMILVFWLVFCRFAEGLPVIFAPSSLYLPSSLPSSRHWSFEALTVLKPKFTDLRVSLRWRTSLGWVSVYLHIKLCWILQYLSWWYCGFLAPSPPENRSNTSIFSQDILSVSHLTSQRRLHLTAMYTLKSTWNCIHNLFFFHVSDLNRIFIKKKCRAEL